MNELPQIVQSFPVAGQWGLVLSLTWCAFLGSIYIIREWRETRKLSAEDRLALRDGYAAQVQNLQIENRDLRKELQGVMKAHDDYRALCHAETDQLRRMVMQLEAEIEGLKRNRAQDIVTDLRRSVKR